MLEFSALAKTQPFIGAQMMLAQTEELRTGTEARRAHLDEKAVPSSCSRHPLPTCASKIANSGECKWVSRRLIRGRSLTRCTR